METNVPADLLAYIALFSWPLLGIGIFLMFPPRLACAVTLVGGEMFLPSSFIIHIKGLPPLDKSLSVSLAAILGCLIVKPRIIMGGSKTGRRYLIFLLIIVVGLYFTVQTNPEPINVVGHDVLPGLTSHDFVLMAAQPVLYWWPAFFLGRKLFTKVEHLEVLWKVLTVGGLVYSLFILVELRLSPQFNMWVYGYRASSFSQSVRYGGYRPVVFMTHGLNVALFMLMSLLAATSLSRARIRLWGVSTRGLVIYLALILLAMHSAGALVNAVVLLLALIFLSSRGQARLATTIATVVLLYPLLRFFDLIPVDSIVGFFSSLLGPERAESLQYRFQNETELLSRALQRPWFGWGGYGRQFTYIWGHQKEVVDGEWIGSLGYSGIVGFIGHFGLLVLPIFVFARKRLRQMESRSDAILASTLLLMSAAFVFDLIPNAGEAPYLTMMIGALAGIMVDRPPRYEWQIDRLVAA